MKVRTLAAVLAACTPVAAPAVYLNPDGLGQALIFPYYTANSAGGNAFNTYLSIVNHAADAKALRVRFREGRNGAEVASFNLFLSPNDAWAAAVVPTGFGAELITRDASCRDGAFLAGPVPSLEFRNTLYAGGFVDGAGVGLDRTREGFVEVLEMAVLAGADAAAVTHNSAGLPLDCGRVQGATTLAVATPTGGLSGSLTLINVQNGQDFTVNAEALAELANAPYYRAPSDAYPQLNAAEVVPMSVVPYEGRVYRSNWTRGIDAVSAVFMRNEWHGEYILDSGTRSRTDFIVTLPTRHYYVRGDGADLPFFRPRAWKASCGETGNVPPGEFMGIWYVNREEAEAVAGGSTPAPGDDPTTNICSSAGVYSSRNASTHVDTGPVSGVTGSINAIVFFVTSTFQNGWLRGRLDNPVVFNSLSTSSRMLRDGTVASGAHAFGGLPMTGFSLRTFENGTLLCNAGVCQGNYGGAFPLQYLRRITPFD